MVRVLFICLGNICRSPMAEAVFRHKVAEAGLGDKIAVDSAGIGPWHVGEKAHPSTRRVLAKHGIEYDGRARQIQAHDLDAGQNSRTYLIAMDQENVEDLRRQFGQPPRLHRLLDFASHHTERDVPDPYYSGHFDLVYEWVEDGCQGLLKQIREWEGV